MHTFHFVVTWTLQFVELTGIHQRGPLSQGFAGPVHTAWILVAGKLQQVCFKKTPKGWKSLYVAISHLLLQSFIFSMLSFFMSLFRRLLLVFATGLIKYRKPAVLQLSMSTPSASHWMQSWPQVVFWSSMQLGFLLVFLPAKVNYSNVTVCKSFSLLCISYDMEDRIQWGRRKRNVSVSISVGSNYALALVHMGVFLPGESRIQICSLLWVCPDKKGFFFSFFFGGRTLNFFYSVSVFLIFIFLTNHILFW